MENDRTDKTCGYTNSVRMGESDTDYVERDETRVSSRRDERPKRKFGTNQRIALLLGSAPVLIATGFVVGYNAPVEWWGEFVAAQTQLVCLIALGGSAAVKSFQALATAMAKRKGD